MGSHIRGKEVVFRVWAPNAKSVSVVGDFNGWDAGRDQMTRITENGVWELVTELSRFPAEKRLYKYCINGNTQRLKADPYARYSETLKRTASVLYEPEIEFHDAEWMESRAKRLAAKRAKALPCPMNIYELHLGSWHTKDDESTADGEHYLNYREIADTLAPYLKKMGYTHAELLPVMEHPFDGSWGYQVCSYFAPTARFGTPEDFAYFVDRLHAEGIGVILDWVPAHFPKDAHGLYEFDGSRLYEYQGSDRMEHKGWGTRFFDVGRNEVQSFLISGALYWLTQFHADGLRCDAVAAMLYLDYDRNPGEWIPNAHGTNINLEAEAFWKKLNGIVHKTVPGALMIAEESSSYPGITLPVEEGGLGFDLKWDMGFSNDSFRYIATDPLFRQFDHRALNFSMLYAFREHYVLPVSHDEVVHGKKSLLDKMFGSYEQKMAGFRGFMGFMMAHPGKKLTFMGTEFGQFREWDYENALEWFLLKYPAHDALLRFTQELNHFYLDNPILWEDDFTWAGFRWINADDADHNIVTFRRTGFGSSSLLCISSFSGAVQKNYRISGLRPGVYKVLFHTDWERFGGSTPDGETELRTTGHDLILDMPPLTTIYLKYAVTRGMSRIKEKDNA